MRDGEGTKLNDTVSHSRSRIGMTSDWIWKWLHSCTSLSILWGMTSSVIKLGTPTSQYRYSWLRPCTLSVIKPTNRTDQSVFKLTSFSNYFGNGPGLNKLQPALSHICDNSPWASLPSSLIHFDYSPQSNSSSDIIRNTPSLRGEALYVCVERFQNQKPWRSNTTHVPAEMRVKSQSAKVTTLS